MIEISQKYLQTYRNLTFRLSVGKRVDSPRQALQFVNGRGFIFFWPVKGIDFPSLWSAHAGNRPVANEHDDPGHATWRWKDDALGKKLWYYAKIIRHKGTFISLDMLPNFYALSPNYGSPEEDFLLQYQEGKLTQECKLIFEALRKEGPMDTLSLRKASHLFSSDSSGRFNKAIGDLQFEFKVLPVGTAEVGAWKYAYVYDLTHRHFPDLIMQSLPIKESQARQKIIQAYFRSMGAARLDSFTKLFPWTPNEINRTVNYLVEKGSLLPDCRVEGQTSEFFADKEFLSIK
jgi:hypothetical protein